MGNLVLGVFSIMVALVLLAYKRAADWMGAAAAPARHRTHARLVSR